MILACLHVSSGSLASNPTKAKLSQNLHVVLSPGIYDLTEPLRVSASQAEFEVSKYLRREIYKWCSRKLLIPHVISDTCHRVGIQVFQVPDFIFIVV